MLFAAFLALFLILWGLAALALPLLRAAGALAAQLLARASIRWTHVARYRAYVPVVVIIGAVITAWAGNQFLDLAELVREKNPAIQHFDQRVHDWAVSRRSAGSTAFFVVMTSIGSPLSVTAIALCAGIALLIAKRYRWLLYLAVTCAGGLLNWELKRFFSRARPDVAEMLRVAHGFSFPSGHAMGSTVVFGALSYLAFRIIDRWRWKTAALAFAAALVIAIATSRVYLGVHWISDVAAGVAAGTMWVGITTVCYETLRRIRMLRVSAK